MKLRLKLDAECEIDDLDELEDLKREIESAVDTLQGSGAARGELKLDLDSLKSRDREIVVANWE